MEYIEGFRALVERAPVFAHRRVFITVIANPMAGGFTIKERARRNKAWFDDALASVSGQPVVTASCGIAMHLTTAPGHARQLAKSVIDVAAEDRDPASLYLLITAGGDGTSLDVQFELARAVLQEGKDDLVNRVCLIRLPFGTGNDGSDGRSLDQTLALLTAPSRIELQRAVRVRSSSRAGDSWYAFNIASIGLDAFVTHMTNKVKHLFPGDFYKIWVDLACVFYSRLYRTGHMRVTATRHDGSTVCTHEDRMLIYLMGASGFRTYGSNQKILPDSNNVCGVRDMSLRRKLVLKPHFRNGTHVSFPETVLYSADRLVIDYDEKILVQLDGEAHLLRPGDFPLTMELTEPFIAVLKPVPAA